MIQNLKQINILDMLDMYGEDACKEILSTFICPLNLDVADFIHNKAIEFAKQRYDTTLNRYLISMPLIAQLGKNYSETAKEFGEHEKGHNELSESSILVQMLRYLKK